ncbi:hypothetical protein AAG570_004354 [Ranatra chinensis]|uniref:TFIIS N-terminal domain-containing protein n=1 Tax=Ranatra chinensis TaxID=642074 RepID=A0ABD0Y0P4_9HEMI
MAAVLEIITVLERTPITKEALGSTRLGRDINELRRKTKNESLARRAKDLVRRWRHMILPQPAGGSEGASTEVQQNGGARGQQGTRPGVGAGVPRVPVVSPAGSGRSSGGAPQQQNRGPTTDPVPKTHAANKRLRKDTTEVASDPEPPAKKVKPPEVTPPAPQQRLNGDHYDSVGSDCEIVSVTPAPRTKQQQRNRKKAPKDRTSREVTAVGGVSADDIVKEKIASIARTPKVKTTQELLADLKSRSGAAATVGGGGDASVALPNDHDVARNKTEHIARFLRSTGGPPAATPLAPQQLEDTSNRESVGSETGTERTKEDDSVSTLETPEQILSRLPPLDLASIAWDEDVPGSSAPPTPPPVTSHDVERVLSERIEGLNGNHDHYFNDDKTGVFREWHQVVSRTSYQGDLLHILPYVVID